MRIINNIPALTAFTSLNSTNQSLQKIIGALSTGLRINSASDDAAGFAVSEKMRSQIRGLDTALRNSQDAISLLQTAEGALSQTNGMLQRMRDLSVQASNDSLTSNDRQYIQLEIDEIMKQIDQIANTTQFNKKRILDGSSGALWASSDPGVSVRINGGLTRTDNFGQKVSSEGNYRIEITASPGEAQVQKSNIFDIQAVNKIIGYTQEIHEICINDGTDNAGSVAGQGWSFSGNLLNITADGKYYIVGKLDDEGKSISTSNGIRVAEGVKAEIFLRDINITADRYGLNMTGAEVDLYLDPGKNGNSNIIKGGNGGHCSAVEVPQGAKLTITSINGDYDTSGTLEVTGTVHGAGIGGSCSGIADAGDITILGGTIIAQGGELAAGIGGGSQGGWRGGNCGNITIYGGNVTAEGGVGGAGIGSGSNPFRSTMSTAAGNITIAGGTVTATGGQGQYNGDPSHSDEIGQGSGIGGGGGFSSAGMTITIDSSASLTASGYASIGSGEFADDDTAYTAQAVTPPAAREVPDLPLFDKPIYEENHKLSDIKQFYNSEGVFLAETPKKITITQGDGQSAEITLYESDSVYDVAEKINDVIANAFGHAQYTDNPAKFCTVSDGTEFTSESIFEAEPTYDANGNNTGRNIHATMLIRSAMPGREGEITFSGDEEILNALGLNTIRESSETKFTASIYDAHSGKVILSDKKLTGNVIHDALTGVDIEFGSMAGIKSSWDEGTKRFIFTGGDKYSAVVHLKDNGITFHTGANMGEDFSIQLGDMSAKSLGLSSVNVAARESAASSIGIIDRAINRVSSQRAKIGSYINGLEHTMSNITTTSANLTAAESRLRDADMAQMMIDFVRLQILNQSGASMLAQANQLPQSVMSLMR